MERIEIYIKQLVNYGADMGLIEDCDRAYATNRLLELLGLDGAARFKPRNGDRVHDHAGGIRRRRLHVVRRRHDGTSGEGDGAAVR